MGIRKVNLSDLTGLSQRGRARFQDEELADALQQMLEDGEPFVWETAVVEGKTDKARTASKAKWRSRAVSVFASLNADEYRLTVRWTDENECVLILSERN